MSPLIWILVSVAAYLIGVAIITPKAASDELRAIQERLGTGADPSPKDYNDAIKWGFTAGFWWPGIIPLYIAISTVDTVKSRLLKWLKKDREKNDPTLKKRRLEERERKVEHMERELGIGA